MTTSDTIEINKLLEGYSVETTPGAATKIPDYRFILTPGKTVYVTLLPGSTIDDTMTICERLHSEGFVPVPHYAARQIPSRKKLENSLIRFRDSVGGTQVLVLAGGSPQPVGEFENSMQLLETGLFDKLGIRTIGIAGHPEGSPDIPDTEINSALKWKQSFCDRTDADMYIITQFCFEANPFIRWEKRLNEQDINLPIHLGIPGVATVGTLLRHAKACGVGNSMNFLKKQARSATKMLLNSNPEKLLRDLARYRVENPNSNIQKIHVYPLGGLRKSVEWFDSLKPKFVQGTQHVA